MLSSLIIYTLISLSSKEMQAIVDRVPDDWYTSTTRLFEYCVDVKFQHPICPRIESTAPEIDFENDFFSAPIGALTPKSLFQATVLYQVKRPPDYWMITLGLDKPRPDHIDKRLWAEAQYLWAKILFDKRKHKESLALFDTLLSEFSGKAVFHQQRAWAQFFNGQFDKALGSIISAESPLLYKIPFSEKYFLRALVEKESCRRSDALNTISSGRAHLSYVKSPSAIHPWVVLCERRGLGDTCGKLKNFYDIQFKAQVKRGLEDLDLLEVELRDANLHSQGALAESKILWPSLGGENWADELGYIVVPIRSKC